MGFTSRFILSSQRSATRLDTNTSRAVVRFYRRPVIFNIIIAGHIENIFQRPLNVKISSTIQANCQRLFMFNFIRYSRQFSRSKYCLLYRTIEISFQRPVILNSYAYWRQFSTSSYSLHHMPIQTNFQCLVIFNIIVSLSLRNSWSVVTSCFIPQPGFHSNPHEPTVNNYFLCHYSFIA